MSQILPFPFGLHERCIFLPFHLRPELVWNEQLNDVHSCSSIQVDLIWVYLNGCLSKCYYWIREKKKNYNKIKWKWFKITCRNTLLQTFTKYFLFNILYGHARSSKKPPKMKTAHKLKQSEMQSIYCCVSVWPQHITNGLSQS